MAPGNAAKVANNYSFWASTVSEPVAMPKIHIVALVTYLLLMVAYSVWAVYDFVNYERPVLFESQETNSFGAVPLDISIDCKDCRRFLEKFPDGSLWSLNWDYSALPGGCASRSPDLFSDELRAFCAAQNDASTREYYRVHLGGCPAANQFSIPWSTSPPMPFGITPTDSACQTKCDQTAGCKAFSYTYGSYQWPHFDGTLYTFPKGMCQLHSVSLETACGYAAFEPSSPHTTPFSHFGLREHPTSTAPNDALDRCTITSNDLAMFTQSASPDPSMTAADAAIPFRSGFGWNANYIGTRPTSWDCYGPACPDYPNVTTYNSTGDEDYTGVKIFEPPWLFGPSTPSRGKGSFFNLKYAVPLCHAPGSTTNPLTIQLASMPHHSFANGGKNIGEAVITLSSGDTFEQVNYFQPWHKNTIHLGLTVNKDAGGSVTSTEPYFANFQYDGRVHWGVEEGLMMTSTAYYRQIMKIVLGENYDGISLREALQIDAGFHGGSWSKEEATNWTAAQWANIQYEASRPGNDFLDMFQQEYEWRTMTVKGGRRLAEDAAAADVAAQKLAKFHKEVEAMATMYGAPEEEDKGGGAAGRGPARRRLSAHDEWGGVQLSIMLGRFANVYQLGHKPGFQDILAAIGGASGSLIGLIGMAIAAFEVGANVLGLRGGAANKDASAEVALASSTSSRAVQGA